MTCTSDTVRTHLQRVHVCVRACVHARFRSCVCACVRACVHARFRACVCACVRASRRAFVCVRACVSVCVFS